MEYIKREHLKEGEIYKAKNSYNSTYIVKLTENFTNCKNINLAVSQLYKQGMFDNDVQFSLATSEEKHWLNECIKADKFIEYEESIKSFIPEYIEAIQQSLGYTIGKIYKQIQGSSINHYRSIDDYNEENGWSSLNFKPSTKEAYDAQFVIKEPEFVLPEKWCIFRNNEHFEEIGKWFNKINNHDGTYTNSRIKSVYPYLNNSGVQRDCLSSYLKGGYTEITFEQFKKYVLKKEIVEEIKVIELLPQFKIIESIEIITKVENNEGNQFFIGDTVKSESNQKGKIISFKYSADKSNIIAITTFQSNNDIGIDKIEHYIEPKVEVKDEFILPEKWCVKVTNNNLYYFKSLSNYKTFNLGNWSSITSLNNACDTRIVDIHHTEITFDQFKKYVLKKEVKEETLLDKAKRLYPIGTKVSNYNLGKQCVFRTNSETFYEYSKGTILIKCPGSGNYTVYFEGKWADIIK